MMSLVPYRRRETENERKRSSTAVASTRKHAQNEVEIYPPPGMQARTKTSRNTQLRRHERSEQSTVHGNSRRPRQSLAVVPD